MDITERRSAADALRAIKRGGEGWFSLSDAVLGRPAPRDEVVARLADLIDPGEDTTVDVYDLLPVEEREALRWVHGHGGLDEVRRDFQDAYNRRVELYSALGIDTDTGWSDAMAEMVKRLMPEGMEWLVEAWPRFEDDSPVRLLDNFERYGEESGVSAVTMYADGSFALNFRAYSKGERVNRPAPKVLDADGAEIRVGDEVWTTRDLDKFIVTNPNNGEFLSVSCKGDDGEDYCCYPTDLTHRAPVLAADGRPLRAGEMVYHIESGDEFTVMGVDAESGDAHVRWGYDFEDKSGSIAAKLLTHQRPDSWERIEEDAGCTATKYNERRGTIFTTKQQVARDLVRRAKKLAERERGE